jgi:hypothetical protein
MISAKSVYMMCSDLDENITLQEALLHPKWSQAIDEEYNSLMINQTWRLVSLPPNRKALTSRWVFESSLVYIPLKKN